MGILKSIGDKFGSKTKTPQASFGGTGSIFDLAFNNPQLMQLMFISAQLGEDPSDLFEPYIVKKVGYDQIEADEDPSLLKIGKRKKASTYIDMGALSAQLPKLRERLQEKATKQFQFTFEKLSQVPALASIFKEAGGGGGMLQQKIDEAFGQLGEFALGAQARGGLLNNPAVQARALAPLALQKAGMEEAGQKNALAQALSLSGAGALPGQAVNTSTTPGSLAMFQPAAFQAAHLGLQRSGMQGGFSLAAQQLQFMKEKEVDAALWKIGGTIGGAMGGGTGGGAGQGFDWTSLMGGQAS
jgi:hypothetical protein